MGIRAEIVLKTTCPLIYVVQRRQIQPAMPPDPSGSLITNRPELREARSAFSETDAPLNPDSSSAFWSEAPVCLLTWTASGEPLTGPPTEVRSRWSRTHLYVLFTCPYETLSLKPNPVTSRETNRL